MATNRKTANEVHPDVALHPGEHLTELLEERKLTQTDLAKKMKRPVQVVNEICRGVKAITAETALQLEAALGLQAETWMNLQSRYELTRARLEQKKPARANAVARARGGA